MNLPTMNVFSFAFVDTTMFAATMTLKYGKHFAANDRPASLSQPPFQNCRHIVLRGPADNADENWYADVNQIDYQLLNEWPSAKRIVEDVNVKLVEQLGAPNLQIGKVYLESLGAGGHVGWHADDTPYGRQHVRFRLLAAPCAGGCWFSGGNSIPPGVGNLTYVNHRTLNSAINLGPVPQISLVVDARRPALQ